MKPLLPVVAIKVFENMMGRVPTADEQSAIRELHDVYAGSDNPAAWWDTVHKYKLECLIGNGFEWLEKQLSDNLKTLRAKDATLASRADIQNGFDNAAFYILAASGFSLVVGIVIGVFIHACVVR